MNPIVLVNKTEKSFSLIGCAKHDKIIKEASSSNSSGCSGSGCNGRGSNNSNKIDNNFNDSKNNEMITKNSKDRNKKKKQKLHGDEAAQAVGLCSLKTISDKPRSMVEGCCGLG